MTEPICTEPPNTNKTKNSLSSGVNSNSKNTTYNGNMKGLKVVFLNIDRLYDRLDELRILANEHPPHIICLNETKLNQDTQDELLAINGFQNIVRQDGNKMGGGVAIYVENNLKFRVRDDLMTDFESISISQRKQILVS